jgi:hypothetical protein
MSGKKIIAIEELQGPLRDALGRLFARIPEGQRDDADLRCLIAFRLQIDGERLTETYLENKLRAAVECGFSGRLFDFIRNDREERACGIDSSILPDEIG